MSKTIAATVPTLVTCTRRLQFCAGHRVYGHESKCANLHGHNYVVMLYARAPKLDSIGRVVDFSVLKSRFEPWIQENWDHGFLFYHKDIALSTLFADERINTLKSFRCDFNPTAEEMAKYLLSIAPALMSDTHVIIYKVKLWETENCFAEAELL